jgi:outer membrane protein assembly factor BamB
MLGLLVRATSGEASLVFANPGDWGIDVLVGDLRGRVTVWQAKYFARGVGRSQQRQIEGSFASALDAAAMAPDQRPILHPHALADEARPVSRHGTGIRRRTAIIAVAGASAAGLLAAARSVLDTSAASGSGASVPSRRPAWKVGTGYAVDCTPAVADGSVYVGNDSGMVYALHASTGDLRWIASTGHNAIFGCLAVAGRTLYAGSNSRRGLYALDTTQGGIRWHHPTGDGVRSGITAADGIVYFSSMDNNVYAADAATGKSRWRFATGGSVQSTPAVANGAVYVGSSDYHLYALDASSERIRWKTLTGGYISSSPTVVDGAVYIGSGDRYVYALDAATGSISWARPTGGPIYFSTPAGANGIVYIVSTDGKVYALDAATGGILWAYATGNEIARSPAVAGGLVYIGREDGNLYAFSAAPHHR